jgi:CRISPR system Cascade subunit CasD
MSFGDQAIDEIRPTRRLPGRSMLAGLLGNALGLDHRDVDALQRLQDRLRFAAREDRGGTLLRDYQTVQLHKKDLLWTTRGRPSVRKGGGTTWDAHGWNTTPGERFYRADAAVSVALALDPADEPPDLDALAAALRRPERPLFLGRKGCPPARPILDALVEVPSLVEALGTAESEGPVETEPDDAPSAERVIDVPDRRDWRQGFHTGLSRRAQLRARPR